MNEKIRTVLVSLTKLGIAGAVIFGIGFLILTQDSSPEATPGEVKKAEADIVDMTASGDGFTEAMLSLGFKPRAYDLNGNIMYFASGYVDNKRPIDVMNTVQEEMIYHGVNSRNWLDKAPLDKTVGTPEMAESFEKDASALDAYNEQSAAMLRGEMVPMKKEPGYISVGSMTNDRPLEETMADYVEAGKEKPLRDQLGGYRFIDATHEPGLDRTMMTAVWTKKDFDSAKMENRSFKPQPADPNVPSCMGCERDFRLQSLNKGENFNHNMWTTRNQGLERTYQFYRQAMANRGWKESGVQPKLDKLGKYLPSVRHVPGRTLNFEKDGKQMTITLLPSPEGGTAVFSSEEFEGGQMILDK